jgi:hypothetical protein
VRIDQGIAHPGLGRQIDHRVELFVGKQGCGPLPVGHVEGGMTKGRMGQQRSQTIPLELRVIVVVEIVETDDCPAFGQQRSDNPWPMKPAAPVISIFCSSFKVSPRFVPFACV